MKALIRSALDEDIGPGDITTLSVIPTDLTVKGLIIAKEDLVLAGIDVAEECFRILDPEIIFSEKFRDGDLIKSNDTVAELSGNARAILMAERVALNFLQRLSGIATLTAGYVKKVEGLNVKIVDTRKTTPGLRSLEKAAVRSGGGFNHRSGLFDGILIKDNHIAISGVKASIEKARKISPHTVRIEVEVKTLNEVKEAIEAGVDIIMLDNMTVSEMKEAVSLIRKRAHGLLIEASGNISLENVRDIAQTGVDIISIGALTHSVCAVDISLKILSTKS